MISKKRALQLRRQAERLYRKVVRWHGTPHAARAARAYAHTIDRLLAYKLQQQSRETTATTTTDPTPPGEGQSPICQGFR
jgi:hypothetical protein